MAAVGFYIVKPISAFRKNLDMGRGWKAESSPPPR